jgi:hypothetical protein
LGHGFTLLRVGDEAPGADGFAAAAKKLGVPFAEVTLPRSPAIDSYESDLLLVRPDHHIAWRGSHFDCPPEVILKRCLGWSTQNA